MTTTPTSSVIAHKDAIDLATRREGDNDNDNDGSDDWDTIVNGLCYLNLKDVRDYVAQRDATLAENVGALTPPPHSSTRNCKIQRPSALLNGNISKSHSPVLELTSPCTLCPLT